MTLTTVTLANDRFKAHSSRSTWGGIALAALLHFALFALMPAMGVADIGRTTTEIEAVPLPREIPPPPENEPIVRPPNPVLTFGDVADVPLPDAIGFDEFADVPAPPVASGDAAEDAIPFTPRDVEPSLANLRDVQRLLERRYPPLLRDAGIGGRVDVWFHIDEKGIVQDVRLMTPSAHEAFDAVALDIATEMKFRPAQYRGRAVPVWVALPIVFTTGR